MLHPFRKFEQIIAQGASFEPKMEMIAFMGFYLGMSENLFLSTPRIFHYFDLIIKAEIKRKLITTYSIMLFSLFLSSVTFFIASIKNISFSLVISISSLILEFIFIYVANWIGKKFYIKFSVSLLAYKIVVVINAVNLLQIYKNIRVDKMPLSTEEKNKKLQELFENWGGYDEHFKEYFLKDHIKYKLIKDEVIYAKKKALSNIEFAAKCAESYIPILLRSGDINTDDSFKYSMRQVAASLREKKKWILTPMEETYEQLITHLTYALSQIMNDNWHNLEQVTPTNTSHSSSLRGVGIYALQVLKTAFLGSLVLLLFLALKIFSPFPLNDAVRSIWLAAGFFWLGITFLLKFDPDIAAKFSLMEKAKTLLPSQETNVKL